MSESNPQIKIMEDPSDIRTIKIEPPDDSTETPTLADSVYIKQERDNYESNESTTLKTKQTSLTLLNNFVQRVIKIEASEEEAVKENDTGKVVASTAEQEHRRSQKCVECGQNFLSERLFLAHKQWHASVLEVRIDSAEEQNEDCADLRKYINKAFTKFSSKKFVPTSNEVNKPIFIKEECGDILTDFVQTVMKIEEGQEGEIEDGKVVTSMKHNHTTQKCEECGQKFLSDRLYLAHQKWHASVLEVKIENSAEHNEVCSDLLNYINETFTSKKTTSKAFCDKANDECGDILINPNPVSPNNNAAVQYVQCYDELTEKINALKQGQISCLKFDTAEIDCYECDICHDTFPLLVMLDSHRRMIHTYFDIGTRVQVLDFTRREQSNDATKKIVTEPEMNTHSIHKEMQVSEWDNQESPKYTCKICKRRFPHEEELNLHLPTHECRYCRKTFATRKLVLEHTKSHNVECEFCHKMLPGDEMEAHTCDLDTLNHHLRAHECKYCKEMFATRKLVVEHVKSHNVECEFCHMMLSGDVMEAHTCDLKLHLRTHGCKYCSKMFATRKLVLEHVKSHNVECEYCHKTLSGDIMEAHTCEPRKHKKLHKCKKCTKKFVAITSLKRHFRLMHRKMFKCEICGSEFDSKYSFNYHSKLHGASRDTSKAYSYTCRICLKGFTSKDALRDHKNNFHTKTSKANKNI